MYTNIYYIPEQRHPSLPVCRMEVETFFLLKKFFRNKNYLNVSSISLCLSVSAYVFLFLNFYSFSVSPFCLLLFFLFFLSTFLLFISLCYFISFFFFSNYLFIYLFSKFSFPSPFLLLCFSFSLCYFSFFLSIS